MAKQNHCAGITLIQWAIQDDLTALEVQGNSLIPLTLNDRHLN